MKIENISGKFPVAVLGHHKGPFSLEHPSSSAQRNHSGLYTFIISMTKLLDADWLRGVQLFH